MARHVPTSTQMVFEAAGSGDSAAARATDAGLRRVDLDGVALAVAPGAAARRTKMLLDEGSSPDRTVAAKIGEGVRLLEVGSAVAARLATDGVPVWCSATTRASAAN